MTVERLRGEIDGKGAAPEVGIPVQPAPEAPQAEGPKDAPDANVGTADVAGQGDEPGEAPTVASPQSPRPRVATVSPALLVRHGGQLGRALLDQPASNSKSVLIRFEEDGRVAEVLLAEVELVELLRD